MGERRGGGKRRVRTRGEKSPSERRGVVRERDRVGARRLAVAVRAAGRALVDGPEHDAAHLSVEVRDHGLLVLDAAGHARVGLRPRLEADDGLGRRYVLAERVDYVVVMLRDEVLLRCAGEALLGVDIICAGIERRAARSYSHGRWRLRAVRLMRFERASTTSTSADRVDGLSPNFIR